MDDSGDIPINSFDIPSVKYELNNSFLTPAQQKDSECAFFDGDRNRSKRNKFGSRENPEILQTLLTSQSMDANVVTEKLMDEGIKYRDLRSLTDADLEMLGIVGSAERAELLECFQMLPNQDPNLEEIYQMPGAKNINKKIFKNANAHLTAMESVLAAIHCQLRLNQAKDNVVGDKNYASKFFMHTLDEISKAAVHVQKELCLLKKISEKKKAEKKMAKFKKIGLEIMVTAAAISIVCGIWYFKIKK